MQRSSQQRLFAVIPAAGRSRRMGEHKLLLEVNGETLIRRSLRKLSMPEFTMIGILIRPDDQSLRGELDSLLAEMPRLRVVVAPSDTPDMKASVQLLLRAIAREFGPNPQDGWLLIPADHPVVEEAVRQRVVSAWRCNPDAIVVASHQGQRGHPTVFPWKLAASLQSIPADQGLNWLLQHGEHQVIDVDCPEESVLWDVDTPEDFARLRDRLNSRLFG